MGFTRTGWDFGWLLPHTDGFVAYRLCNPYTLEFRKSEGRHATRWFVRWRKWRAARALDPSAAALI